MAVKPRIRAGFVTDRGRATRPDAPPTMAPGTARAIAATARRIARDVEDSARQREAEKEAKKGGARAVKGLP